MSIVCEDYDDGFALIANGEGYKGPERIAQFFKDLFVELPKNCAFDLPKCIVLDKHVFIMWNAEGDTAAYNFATDTFTIVWQDHPADHWIREAHQMILGTIPSDRPR